MTSTQADIEVSYSVDNAFFELWLDENMHYTSAVFEPDDLSLEAAQENKARILYDYAEITPEKRVLDIGCGWGSMLDHIARRGAKFAEGITLSTAQAEWSRRRQLPNTAIHICDYKDWSPAEPYDALVSVEMIDHLCSPAQAREGKAVEIYREYFNTCAKWVKPGDCFGFQAILTNRIPRTRQDLLDLQFTADIIFPGGRNPRLEELVAALNPSWELIELKMRRTHYGKTTAEWLRRLRLHETTIRARWGDQLFVDYERYLDTCVRGFANHWSGDVQMKLRKI